MNNIKKYRACIIGCGDIGFLFDHGNNIPGALTHFRAFKDSEFFELCAVTESKDEIRKLIECEYEIPVYEDYEGMCSQLQPEVIIIASNDESHFEILSSLPKYNPKLVFCEKPLASNSCEVTNIVNCYTDKNILLQVNYTRRFLNEFREIKEIIEKNSIGNIESATFYYSRGLTHNASHYIDLCLWYFGEPQSVSLVSTKDGISPSDNTISFNMMYPNNMEVRFIGLSSSKLSFAEIDFVGSEGRVKVNYKNEVETYKVVPNNIYKGYSIYEMKSCKPIDYARALPNAVTNIYQSLNKAKDLYSPASYSIKIFELIKQIKGILSWQN